MYEIKKTTQDMERTSIKIRKVSEKKSQTEILEIKSLSNQLKNTSKNHSSELEQVEVRISRLKDKNRYI
jgi:hypothetical protein